MPSTTNFTLPVAVDQPERRVLDLFGDELNSPRWALLMLAAAKPKRNDL
jgi:hypothetical protein